MEIQENKIEKCLLDKIEFGECFKYEHESSLYIKSKMGSDGYVKCVDLKNGNLISISLLRHVIPIKAKVIIDE